MDTSSNLLIDESPLIVLPTLAKLLGLNEAIILQQIHFWLRIKQRDQKTYAGSFKEGRWWVYNSAAEWQEQFPWWGDNTIRRALAELIKAGVVVAKQLSPDKWVKTMWYTIDYDRLRELQDITPVEKGSSRKRPSTQNGHIDVPNMADGSTQDEQIEEPNTGASTSPGRANEDLPKMGTSLSESLKESKSETSLKVGGDSTSSFSRIPEWPTLSDAEREPWRQQAEQAIGTETLSGIRREEMRTRAIDNRAAHLYEQSTKRPFG